MARAALGPKAPAVNQEIFSDRSCLSCSAPNSPEAAWEPLLDFAGSSTREQLFFFFFWCVFKLFIHSKCVCVCACGSARGRVRSRESALARQVTPGKTFNLASTPAAVIFSAGQQYWSDGAKATPRKQPWPRHKNEALPHNVAAAYGTDQGN